MQTLTFKTLYVLFFIEHARRHLVNFNVTEHPTVAWAWQQLRAHGGTLRRECLDHLIVLNEQQLRTVLSEFVAYYNRDRPHRSLALRTPEVTGRPQTCRLVCHPILGGLHHSYEWAA